MKPRTGLDYRTVWRWHFYASLFCMPFVIVLSITGAIYLFKPQIDRWRDSAYDNVVANDQPAELPSAQIQAAMTKYPEWVPAVYELPTSDADAVRLVMQKGTEKVRVFVHPSTLRVLGSRPEEGGPVRLVRTIHGQLGMGERGSNLVELASSWTIIMVVTGLYLWWPRAAQRWAGVVYPRWRAGTKVFYRDLHSVTGVWISVLVLFLLMSGLPWAKFWGNYLKTIRSFTATSSSKVDWTIGGVTQDAMQQASQLTTSMETSEHSGHSGHEASKTAGQRGGRRRNATLEMPQDLTAFDRLAALAQPMSLAYPATISPPARQMVDGQLAAWTIKSDAQNRPLRVTMEVRPDTAEIVSREDFAAKHWLDKLIAYGIAAHEGQLFGWANQLLGLFAALGLVLLSVSGSILWWRRRERGLLGAPRPPLDRKLSWLTIIAVISFGLYLPLFGLSLLWVLASEWLVLRRIPRVKHWLGLVG